jgi:signal transduction histidine kinase
LDIKLKSNKQSKIFGNLLCIILIAFISVCAIASYPLIQKNVSLRAKQEEESKDKLNKKAEEYYKTRFTKTLYKGNYVLAMKNEHQLIDINLKPSHIFLPDDMLRTYGDENFDEKDTFIHSFNNLIDDWQNDFYSDVVENYPDFQYYLMDNNSGNFLTNSLKSLSLLMENSKEAQELKEAFPFYIVFQYREDGSLVIPDYKGLTQRDIDEYRLLELNKSEMQNQMYSSLWYQYKDKVKSPSNVTIIYASGSEEFYKADNIMFMYSNPSRIISEAGLVYVFVACVIIVFLLAMLLPLKKSWNIGKGISSKIPLEINVVGIAIAIASFRLIEQAAWETTNGNFFISTEAFVIPDIILELLDYSINFILWFGVLSIIFITLLSMRQVFTLGLIEYLKEKTLIGRFSFWLYRSIKKLIKTLGDIDLTDSSNLAIIKILAVNFVILLLMCSIWVFGIILLAIYSIILFFVIRKYYNDIRSKYKILLNGTSRIAEGDLEYTISEDLGVFEPLKAELSKVQNGFRKAVEEEVKSQRMKTELITNVSHDLKTPLTAIITYVNLLKDEGISEEERKSYIDTLDLKSQRLKTLIEDLFEVSKASSNNVTLNIVDVDIVDLIKQLLLELDNKINESNIDFRFNHPNDKLILKLDSEKTYRIFENLFTNVIKYSLPHTRAYIDITKVDNTMQIAIKNVSAAELNFSPEEITERFVRGDQSRSSEGSGLGLAIAKSFVELQGGRFNIEVDGDLFKVIIQWKLPTYPQKVEDDNHI